MIDAEVLARSLVGEPLRTPSDARTNTILRIDGGQMVVSTSRTPAGRAIPLSMLQDSLDRLGAGEELPIQPGAIGHRSSFLGAVLLTLPMVEVSTTRPPLARLRGGALPLPDVLAELETRLGMYARLIERGGPTDVRPEVLRDIGLYGGGGGVWTDTARTRGIGGAPAVTVGLLHTGRHYADDLSDNALLYHYPETGRPAGRDAAEVEATRRASLLGLPVFVILQAASRRSVRRGWVVGGDDDERVFLVEFGPVPSVVTSGDAVDIEPFDIFEDREDVFRRTRGRPNQQRFKFQVVQRYGGRCAVCDSSILEWLDAAHFVADSERGSSDPRNGIPLCKNHHAAFDGRLLAIDSGGQVYVRHYNAAQLGVTRRDLTHLPNQPAPAALRHRWERSMADDWTHAQ